MMPDQRKQIADILMQTWPARMAKDALQAIKAPGNAYASTPENPVTTQDMIAPAANLAGLMALAPLGGAPSGALGSGAIRRAANDSVDDVFLRLENVVSDWSKGLVTTKDVKKAFKDSGWSTDLRRGSYEVEAFDPTGKQHFLTP